MELDDYLREQVQEGSFHSTGCFRLDPRKVWERLGSFQNRPGFHLLSLVRCSVSSGAGSVEIRLSRARVEFQCRGGRSFPGLVEELASWLRGTSDRLSERASFLSAGVVGAASLRPRRVEVRGTGDGRALRLVLGAEGFETWEHEGAGEPGLLVIVRRRGLARGELHRQLAAEHRAVCSRCAYCPIPVRLDGRWVNQGLPPLEVRSYEGPRTELPQDFELLRCLRSGPGRRGVRLPIPRDGVRVLRSPGGWRLERQVERPSVFFFFSVDAGEELGSEGVRLALGAGPRRLVLVWAGVALDPERLELPWPFATELVADLGEVRVDASGFGPIQDGHLQERLHQLRELAFGAVGFLLEALPELASPYLDPYRHPHLWRAALLGGAAWGGAAWLLNPPGMGWLAAPVSATVGALMGAFSATGYLYQADRGGCLVWRTEGRSSNALREWIRVGFRAWLESSPQREKPPE